jgi:hypothetical protein
MCKHKLKFYQESGNIVCEKCGRVWIDPPIHMPIFERYPTYPVYPYSPPYMPPQPNSPWYCDGT